MKAIITLLAALAFAGGSLLTSDFGGFDPNRFPVPQENPPLQPVGFAFGIWLPIYAWLIANGVFGVTKRYSEPSWQAFRTPLIVSMLIGAPWIRVARVSPLWSTLMIWAMLAFALWALYRAPELDFAWARGPIGLYAGWLTAASAVATSVLLSGYGLLPGQYSAVIMLFVALALAIATILKTSHSVPTYALAVEWALAGIIVKSVGTSNYLMIGLASLGCVVVAAVTWRFRKLRSR
jgi:hypothetical protein